MMKVNALFMRKEPEIEASPCMVDKVVQLSALEFDRFSRNLLCDWDFIRNNPIDRIFDEKGRYHCLLVVGDGRRDGILVNSEGSDYARYSAFIPNAAQWLILEQYPALAELNQKLTTMVEDIVKQATVKNSEGRVAIDMQWWDGVSEEDGTVNTLLINTVLGMLDERPEIQGYELDKNELIIYQRESESLADVGSLSERAAAGEILPGTTEENNMFYHNDSEDSLCVGYLRGDFGTNGEEFWHSWFDADSGKHTPEFKAEFQNVMDKLRRDVLKDYDSSSAYCYAHPEARLPGDGGYYYGFRLEMESREYFVRCTTLPGDDFYVFAYDKAPAVCEREYPTEKPSVLKQIREAKKNPVPHKQKDGPGDMGPEL